MKYINFIPLIGGMAIANNNIVGHKPYCVLSYDAFKINESNLQNYWKDVQWYLLNNDTNELDELINFENIDFVSSVCPCAGMSGLNLTNRGADAKQNNWLYKVAEYTLSVIKPKVYWGENAPGLYSEQNEAVLNKLREYGDKYGYSFTIYKTDSYLHGIPQHRIRTFFFFWKSEYCPLVNWYKETPESFNDYIVNYHKGDQRYHLWGYDHPEQMYPEMDWILKTKCHNNYLEYMNLFYDEIDKHSIRTPYDYIKFYDLWDEYEQWLLKDSRCNKPLLEHGKHTPLYYVQYRHEKTLQGKGYFAAQPIVYKDVSTAIISKNMLFILHPTECRFLNTREIMHMMGLPSDYQLISGNLQHVTQNVPVKTAMDMTKEVVKFINDELEMTTYKFIKQNNLIQKIDKTI